MTDTPSLKRDSFEDRQLVGRLRFRHLQLLLALRDAGSLHAAAQLLSLTQPALSKALAEVEGAFGCPLFVRSSRGVLPNAKGELAVRGAAQLLSELSHLGSEVSSGATTVVLRIGAPPFVARGYLPEVLQRVLSTPGAMPVRIQLEEERVPSLVHMLQQGRLDALITSYPAEMPDLDLKSLTFERLYDAAFAVIAPAGHPLGRVRRVTWLRLSGEPWILPSDRSMVRRSINGMFNREGIRAPASIIESTNPLTNVHLVAQGLGLAAVPLDLATSALRSGQVQRLKVHPAIPDSPVSLVYRSGSDNARVLLLRDALGLSEG